MSKGGAPRHDPVPIGEIATPPFARLPDPASLFARRATRFGALSDGDHELRPYLRFLAEIANAQHETQDALPEPPAPEPETLRRASASGMPPLDRSRLAVEPAFVETLARLLERLDGVTMPTPARAALAHLAHLDRTALLEMARAVLADAVPMETLAEHVFVASALQIDFACAAAQLDAKTLVPIADGVCPACGGAPVTSLIVGWNEAHGTRFCACSLCATLWNYVRIKCTLCGSTKGIGYTEVDGGPGTIKAETCDECRGYVKILHQHSDPKLDPVADDVGALALDILVRDAGYRRGGVNPFLIGY